MSSSNSIPPLYRSIADVLSRRIAEGRYKPGQRIPAIRAVAAEFGCNKLTVQKAFDRLKTLGLIENQVGRGSFVKFPRSIRTPEGFYDFRTDYPDESFFPFRKAQGVFNELFENERSGALTPAPVAGDPSLIEVLSRYFRVPADRMLILSGAQQGLDLTAKVFATGISESMLFEDPTYPGAITLFKARHFVPMANDGPVIGELDTLLNPVIRLFYTMPAVHHPTGIAYSAGKRRAVAARARRHPFYIIEDDYLAELAPDAGPRFIDICPERTIFIKSLAQTTAAGIRLGFMVVPADLFDSFAEAKYSSDIASSGLLQKFMRDFMDGGHYDAHVRRMQKKSAARAQRLRQLIGRYPDLHIAKGQSGYALWVRVSSAPVVSQVPWSRGEEFSFSPDAKRHLRIAFMHMDDACFEKGLAHLGVLFDQIQDGLSSKPNPTVCR